MPTTTLSHEAPQATSMSDEDGSGEQAGHGDRVGRRGEGARAEGEAGCVSLMRGIAHGAAAPGGRRDGAGGGHGAQVGTLRCR